MTTVENPHQQRDLNLIGLTQLDEQGYSTLAPQQWPVLSKQEALTHHRFFGDGRFFTADGKANFIAVQQQSPQQTTSEQYPLILNSGRSRDQWHTMTRTGLSARLGEFDPEPFVQIHPETAQYLDIDSGDVVKVSNQRGSFLARAQLTDDVSPEQLYAPIHWSHQTAKHSKPCSVIAPLVDALSGQPEFKHTPVSVTRCEHQSKAMLLSRDPLDRHHQAMDNIDYWARQKVDAGYLYLFESELKENELSLKLEELLQHTQGRRYETSMGNQQLISSLRYKAGQRHALWICASIDVALDKSLMIASFEREQEDEILAALTL